MLRLIVLPAIYVIVISLLNNRVYASIDLNLPEALNINEIVSSSITNSTVTYKDKNYQNPTNKFQGNDTVYIRFSTNSTGELKHEILLLDSSKNKIQSIELSKQGQNPFVYTGSFKLAKEKGQYYLSINIKDKENSFSFQQNIEVVSEGLLETDNLITITPEDKKEIVYQDNKDIIIKEKETYTRKKEEFNLLNFIKEMIIKSSDFIKDLIGF